MEFMISWYGGSWNNDNAHNLLVANGNNNNPDNANNNDGVRPAVAFPQYVPSEEKSSSRNFWFLTIRKCAWDVQINHPGLRFVP